MKHYRGEALTPPSGATGEPRPYDQRTQRAEAKPRKRNKKRGLRSEGRISERKETFKQREKEQEARVQMLAVFESEAHKEHR